MLKRFVSGWPVVLLVKLPRLLLVFYGQLLLRVTAGKRTHLSGVEFLLIIWHMVIRLPVSMPLATFMNFLSAMSMSSSFMRTHMLLTACEGTAVTIYSRFEHWF